MNNWRLLLLAVVAVLQPSGSFTKSNLIDGRQGCCDHQSRSANQDSSLYGNYRKSTPEDHRLNSLPLREDSRRLQARTDPIVRSRERLTVERIERRVIPDSTARLSTEARFARDQEHRQRLLEAREPRQAREDRSRRTREHISRDSLTHYQRDALDSRRVRMSRDDANIGRVTTRTVRDAEDYRRHSANRETMLLQRNSNNVARDEIRRDSRFDKFRFGNRVQHNNERRSSDRRARENVDEIRRSRSAESRENGVYAENRRSTLKSFSERVDDRRREFRERALNQRDSSERISRNSMVRQDQTRRVIRDNRHNEKVHENRQQRVESRMSRETSPELRESRPVTEHRITQESRRNERSHEKTETRREIVRDLERVSRDRANERRLSSRARDTTRVLANMRSDETREDRRQLLTRSLERADVRSPARSNEREVRISDRAVRDERAARNRREVRSVERMDERREQRYESRMSQERQMANLRVSRDSSERRQDTSRIVSPYRVEVNARTERESRLRETRDNKRSDVSREREEVSREQALIRLTRDIERKDDSRLSRNSRSTERVSDERMSRMREAIRRERSNVRRETIDDSLARVVEARRFTRDISPPTEIIDSRRTSRTAESESRSQRTRSLDNIRDVRERDEISMARDRVSTTRLVRERIDNEGYRVPEIKDARIDARYVITRNREARAERYVAREKSERRSRNLVLQRQSSDILAARSEERRSREASRDTENRAERLSMSRDERRINEKDVRNVRDVRTEESRRDNRMTDTQVLLMQRVNRVANRESNDVRFDAKQRSTNASRSSTRRETETRFQNFAAKVREADSVDETYGQGVMSWQIIFYTLQGAYLCGLLMQMLCEKSNKGKTRNFSWWTSAKELIKVD